MNLAEQYPEACAKLIAEGKPAIAEMARHFTDARAMSLALRYHPSAALHWLKGRKNASNASNAHAAAWLKANVAVIAPATPATTADDSPFLAVVCPPGRKTSILKMLAMIGCEVVEV